MLTTNVVLELTGVIGLLGLHKFFSKHRRRVAEACFELGLILLLYAIYDLSASFAHGAEDTARRNAMYIIDLEERMGLAVEQSVQQWLLANSVRTVMFLNVWYLGMHWIGCLSFFIWLFARRGSSPLRHKQWKQYRTCFMVMNYFAFFCYFVFPLMPPRLVPEKGYIDTIGHVHGSSPYKESHEKINPYGAMPSMHFGWAFLFAFALSQIDVMKQSLRYAPFVYPGVMLLSIVTTGNHYILDAVGGLLCAALAIFSINFLYLRTPDCEPSALEEMEEGRGDKPSMYNL